MKQFVLYLACVCVISSCRKSATGSQQPPVSTTTFKYLALGDSYTIGQSVSAGDRFPNKTAFQLRANGVTDPTIIAATGWTTGNLIQAVNDAALPSNFDLVSLLIGVNNQFQGRSQVEYRSQFTILLMKAIQLAGNRSNRVVVISIPDYSVTPYAQGMDTVRIAREIDEFNAINREVAMQYNVQYLDITGISREGRNDPSLQANDGLHPSGKQYQRWSDLLSPLFYSMIR